jgi:hypothetical protein
LKQFKPFKVLFLLTPPRCHDQDKKSKPLLLLLGLRTVGRLAPELIIHLSDFILPAPAPFNLRPAAASSIKIIQLSD